MLKLRKILKGTSGRARVAILFTVLALLVGTVALATGTRPTRTTTISSHEQLRGASPAFQNFVQDRPTIWVPLHSQNFAVSCTTDAAACAATVVGMGNATPTLGEITTSEISGFTCDASNDSASVIIPIPADMDLAKTSELRALWSNSEAAGTGTGKVTFTYEIIDQAVDALAAADDAVDTAAAAQTDLAANIPLWTGWSTINASTIDGEPGEDLLIIKAKCTLTTIADMSLIGIQFRYYRKWLGGD